MSTPKKDEPAGKPKYIPGENMTQYNQRVAQWLKKQAAEKGTQAAFTSKNKRADTGTASQARVGTIDSGEFQNEATASASDAGIAYGGQTADSGTFESTPVSYEQDAPAAVDGGYADGGYADGGYTDGGTGY